MPIYNILKTYNRSAQLEIVSQRDRLLQEFVLTNLPLRKSSIHNINSLLKGLGFDFRSPSPLILP